MNEEQIEFYCPKCRKDFTVNENSTEKILQPASPCSCEFCGWDDWTEYKTFCPSCNEEITTL